MNINDLAADLVIGLLNRATEDDSDEMFDFMESMIPETTEGTFQDLNWETITTALAQSTMFRQAVIGSLDMLQDIKMDNGDDEYDFEDMSDLED